VPRIVISYRRADTLGIAGRIFDKLRTRYGDTVFMDVSSNRPGRDFRKQINKALQQCDLVVAVIGPRWTGGSRRHTQITDPLDPIRLELETALQLDIPIVPVLVDGAEMPTPSDLPKALKDLSFIHAASVDAGADFHPDMDRLAQQIDELSRKETPGQSSQPEALRSRVALDRGPPTPLAASISAADPKESWGERLANRAGALRAARGSVLRPYLFGALSTVVVLGVAGALLLSRGIPSNKGPVLAGVDAGGILVRPEGILKPMASAAKELRSIAFSPKGTSLAVAGDDAVIRIWDATSFKLVGRLPATGSGDPGHRGSIRKIAFSTDGSKLISASHDKTVRIWDVGSGRLLTVLEDAAEPTEFFSVAVFPGEPLRWVMAGGMDGKIRTWDVQQPTPLLLTRKPAHKKEVFAVSFSPNAMGDYVTAGRDGFINVYARPNKDEPIKIAADSSAVFHVKYSATGERLLSAGGNGAINVWTVAGPTAPKTYEGLKGYALTADWSPKGEWLAAGGKDRILRLWNVDTPRPLHQFVGHEGDIEAVAFHPNGKWLVSASEDRQLKIWTLNGREELFTLVAFNDDEYIAYRPDGHFTGTASGYRHVKRVSSTGDHDLTANERMELFLTAEHFASLISDK